jgi:hypothetical protein
MEELIMMHLIKLLGEVFTLAVFFASSDNLHGDHRRRPASRR